MQEVSMFSWGLIIMGFFLVQGALIYYFRDALKGYKTVIWNALLAANPTLLFIVDKVTAMDLQQYMTPTYAAVAGILIGVIGLWLRAMTSGPVGEK